MITTPATSAAESLAPGQWAGLAAAPLGVVWIGNEENGNVSFESGTVDGWATAWGASCVSTPAPHGGSYCMQLDASGSYSFTYSQIGVSVGKRYRLSCYAKGASGGESLILKGANTGAGATAFTLTTEWTQYTIDYTAAHVYDSAGFLLNSGVAYVDDASLREVVPAAIPGDWGPSALAVTNNGATLAGTHDGMPVWAFDGADSVSLGTVFAWEWSQAKTLMAWVRTTAVADGAVIGNLSPPGYSLLVDSYGRVKALNSSAGWSNYSQVYSSYLDPVNDGEWHHIALVDPGDGLAANMLLIVDGVPVETTKNDSGGFAATIVSSQALRVGYASGTGCFDGDIADPRIYSTALSSAEIQAVYERGSRAFLRRAPLQNLIGSQL